ncbi:choice-of-anchor D domain-containing protein [Ekhidna sp.]
MKSKPNMVLWTFSMFAILLSALNAIGQQEITVTTTSIDESLEPGNIITVNVTITNDGDAPLNWSSELGDVYGRGPGVAFSKDDFANWIIPANQDRIANNVWIARADNQSIFNAKSETSANNSSPTDTEWASGGLNAASSFDTFKNMHGGDPQSLIGNTATLHAISDDEYFELDFSGWTGSNGGGGFAYTRYKMYEYLNFNSVTTGTLAAAEQVILAIQISANDIMSGTYAGSLTITSDDADEGTIVIPINLEVLPAATFEVSANSFSQTLNTGDVSVTETFTISNNGVSDLNWSSTETSGRPSEMSGVTLDNFSGTVASGESQVVTITFSDNGNNEGMYEWPLTLFSNDPSNSNETINISLEIIGEALIDYDELDPFEDTFLGTTSNQTFTIYNEGTADLVVSGITSSSSQFTPTSTILTIEPEETADVSVLFSPDAASSFSGNITITSNDAETPSVVIPVSGNGVSTPQMSVSPLAFSESISTSETANNTVTVSNSGDGELEWTVNINAGALEPTGTFFEKDNGADISLEANQDRLSAEVWLVRGSSEPMFNYFEETSWSESTATIE